jgi:hypothetical protein
MAKKNKRGIKNQKKIVTKSGLSPVITSVLLIALVVVIISVIFLWFRGMVEEGVVKFEKNIQLVCDDVNFEATYSSGTLNIVNNGNVPIFKINLKIYNGGNYQTKSLESLDGGNAWPSTGLGQGATFSGNIGADIGSADKMVVLPILLGTSSKGKKTFMCEGQYGQEIKI